MRKVGHHRPKPGIELTLIGDDGSGGVKRLEASLLGLGLFRLDLLLHAVQRQAPERVGVERGHIPATI